VSVKINLSELLQKLDVMEEPDVGSIRVIRELKKVPFVLSFSREVGIEDFEGDLTNWEFSSEIVSEKEGEAVQGSYSLKFKKGTLKEAYNVLKLDQRILRESNFISVVAKDNFTVVLRDEFSEGDFEG